MFKLLNDLKLDRIYFMEPIISLLLSRKYNPFSLLTVSAGNRPVLSLIYLLLLFKDTFN